MWYGDASGCRSMRRDRGARRRCRRLPAVHGRDNEPPRILGIDVAGGKVYRGPQLFTARVEDDHDDPQRFNLAWTSRPGPCPPSDQPGGNLHVGPDYLVPVMGTGEMCVRVETFDGSGARASLQTAFTIGNRVPSVTLTKTARTWPSGKVRLYGIVELTAEGSDPDGDKLSYAFKVKGPDGSAGDPPPCPAPADAKRCLTADKPDTTRLR